MLDLPDDAPNLDRYLFDREGRWEHAPGRTAPPTRGVAVPALDGLPLAATVTGTGPRVVVVASATGVKRRYYARFARSLAGRGFSVVTFDYRGIGDSVPGRVRDVDARMHDWGALDLAGVVRWASDTLAGGGPVGLVGHSVGGQLVGLLPEPERIAAVVAVGAQSGDYRLWSGPRRLAMAALWYGVVPGVARTFGYLPGSFGIGEDLPAGVALEWARWCRTPGYLAGEAPERLDGFARLRAPVLAYSFSDDGYAPRPAVEALLALFRGAEVEHRHVRAGVDVRGRVGHFGFFRKKLEASHWGDVARFLAEAPLPASSRSN